MRHGLDALVFTALGVVAGLVFQWLRDGGADVVAEFVLALVPNF